MGQAKNLAGGAGTKKGSPGVKMGSGWFGKGLARGALAGSKGFAGEQQGKRRRGMGGLLGAGAAMRMAGSVGQKKEECD